MTDDPNAEDSLEGQSELPENEQLADEEVVESAPAETEAAPAETEAAHAETEAAHAVEPAGDVVEEEDEGDEEAGRAPTRGPAQRRRVVAGTAAGVAAARSRNRGIVIDPALRIRDRVSEAFVIGTVLVFALIFGNALLFGNGGALSPTPSPVPSGLVESFAPVASEPPTIPPIPTEFQVPPRSPSPGASESVAPSPS